MGIAIGTQVGSYKIIALLGKGGMDEVYRAHDTKLKRDVAVKILPEEFTRDSDRVNRFQREAEVLASLNHPNIATIHDLDNSNGTHALIMELVEGGTLADILQQRGPLPVDEALKIGKQICEALEAAHERGIVHRDLKPGNVKITPDSKVKVLDFGLAKAIEGAASNPDFSNSPTLVPAGTSAGLILGTAAYMSPEQAKGFKTDRRSDVFSFGCVLYEMLTGRPAFNGDAVSDILASVLKSEPDWRALPGNLHPRIPDLLRRLLQKDKDRRLHDIADARIEIEDALNNPALGAAPGVAQIKSPKRAALLLAIAGFAVAVAVSTLYLTRSDLPEPAELRLDVNTPPTNALFFLCDRARWPEVGFFRFE